MRFLPPYEPQAIMSSPAAGRAQIWRLVLGVMLTIATAVVGGIIWVTGLAKLGLFETENVVRAARGMLAMLFSFGFLTLGVIAAAALLHRRTLRSLLGKGAAAQGTRVFLCVLPIYALFILLPMPEDLTPVRSALDLSTWARMLPFALLAILVQVSAEEIAFRGYLQSQLAARFTSRWVWMVLPSLGFGALHYSSAAGPSAVLMVIWAAAFGLIAADLTARSGSLGPAIALHFTHNSGLLYASMEDNLSDLSLYLIPMTLSDTAALWPMMVLELGVIVLAWRAARWGLGR